MTLKRFGILVGFGLLTTAGFARVASADVDGGVACTDDGTCDALEDCSCVDCKPTARCNPDQCVDDGKCDVNDSCICADCQTDMYCSDPKNCKDDGMCVSFEEGCACVDCMSKPACNGGAVGPAVTSGPATSGAGNGGGDASGVGGASSHPYDSGCAVGERGAQELGGATAIAIAALGLARLRRSKRS